MQTSGLWLQGSSWIVWWLCHFKLDYQLLTLSYVDLLQYLQYSDELGENGLHKR